MNYFSETLIFYIEINTIQLFELSKTMHLTMINKITDFISFYPFDIL